MVFYALWFVKTIVFLCIMEKIQFFVKKFDKNLVVSIIFCYFALVQKKGNIGGNIYSYIK